MFGAVVICEGSLRYPHIVDGSVWFDVDINQNGRIDTFLACCNKSEIIENYGKLENIEKGTIRIVGHLEELVRDNAKNSFVRESVIVAEKITHLGKEIRDC